MIRPACIIHVYNHDKTYKAPEDLWIKMRYAMPTTMKNYYIVSKTDKEPNCISRTLENIIFFRCKGIRSSFSKQVRNNKDGKHMQNHTR